MRYQIRVEDLPKGREFFAVSTEPEALVDREGLTGRVLVRSANSIIIGRGPALDADRAEILAYILQLAAEYARELAGVRS